MRGIKIELKETRGDVKGLTSSGYDSADFMNTKKTNKVVTPCSWVGVQFF